MVSLCYFRALQFLPPHPAPLASLWPSGCDCFVRPLPSSIALFVRNRGRIPTGVAEAVPLVYPLLLFQETVHSGSGVTVTATSKCCCCCCGCGGYKLSPSLTRPQLIFVWLILSLHAVPLLFLFARSAYCRES